MHLMSSGSVWPPEILTVEQMAAADHATIQGGRPGIVLMENAGRAVADNVAARFPDGPVTVLAGPGNNGGDGLVAARNLARFGRDVRVALFGNRDALAGDAARAMARWTGPTDVLGPGVLEETAVVVDAVFGAGLSRSLPDSVASSFEAARARGLPSVAVDLPSGVDGNTGAASAGVLAATTTVTFHRLKPAHVLFPGRALAGELVLADIGVTQGAGDEGLSALMNGPLLWRDQLPLLDWRTHKYARGHVIVVGGPAQRAGAARLAAHAALRAGAGLVTLAVPDSDVGAYTGEPKAVMVEPVGNVARFEELVSDSRVTAVVLGPGNGVGDATRERVRVAARPHLALVLDADALTSFGGDADSLAALCKRARAAVLTPHEGEFRRLLPDVRGDRLSRARVAARRIGATMIHKGPDTVIVGPGGQAIINANAPPDLATAGSGDVLAGIVGGLLAGRMEPLAAASASVWLHGEAAAGCGRGLIADDLLIRIPEALHSASS